MSAWLVSREHIDALVTIFARSDGRRPALDPETAVGRLLWEENRRSVAYRYPGDEAMIGEFDPEYTYTPRLQPPRPAVANLKLVRCYEYQSCEHPGWEQSEAYRLCQRMTGYLVSELPGYDEAPWGI